MRKNFIGLFLLVLLVLSTILSGCQQSAQKPYTDNNNQTNTEMTENERRVLAGRLSNLAEEVDGVKKASVIVSSIGITQNNTTTNTIPNSTTDNTDTNTTNNTRTTLPANPTANNIANPGTTNMNTPNTNTGTGINTNTTNNTTGLVVMAGITMEDNVMNDAAKMKTIKQTVSNRLRGADSRINQILVTSDPDLIKRINDVATGLLKGKPVTTFENDIKKLGRDIQKETPAF
ncbi:MAG TPA: hypothetical protein PKN87_05645 [Syntrophomonadaceae bacterium]|nr:hypothetical protein [Syntrophomonadaceae bacterium]HNX28881.1 hypothetical protein [Syntrophomonadaceae bacterium]HPR93252.1 hypothetical protein [Syntrophomonadaceae bacterium]